MYHAMQYNWWHDVNEERGDFVQRMEDQAVPPHGNCDSIVAVGQAVCGDEQPFRLWKCPDC